jgi:hypothetical protein
MVPGGGRIIVRSVFDMSIELFGLMMRIRRKGGIWFGARGTPATGGIGDGGFDDIEDEGCGCRLER